MLLVVEICVLQVTYSDFCVPFPDTLAAAGHLNRVSWTTARQTFLYLLLEKGTQVFYASL